MYYNPPVNEKAMVRSVNAECDVQIIAKVGDNAYHALYNGLICTAIYNPFSGYYYADDVDGIVSQQ